MSDRHSKWTRVEPGHVIPAGQPYRVEYSETGAAFESPTIAERVVSDIPGDSWFVDSSWRPPLNLPTEWTWGVITHKASIHPLVGRWKFDGAHLYQHGFGGSIAAETVIGFVPLTDEQVARIEAAR